MHKQEGYSIFEVLIALAAMPVIGVLLMNVYESYDKKPTHSIVETAPDFHPTETS